MYFLPFSSLYFAVMNVFVIVRSRLPISVVPPLGSEIYSLTLIKAPSTRPSSVVIALKPVPWPVLLPLRESRDPEFKRVVAFLTELNILFTSLFICSTSFRETVVFSRTTWAKPNSSLAFSRTSFVVSCLGTSKIAACNWSTDTFKASFWAETVWLSSLALTSEEDSLTGFSASVPVLLSRTSLDSFTALDKVARSVDKSSFSSLISFWTASALSSNAWALWTLSFTEESTDSSRFNLVERREFNSSTTFFNLALSTVDALFTALVSAWFSEDLFAVDPATPSGESTLSLGFTTPALGCGAFGTTLSALATRAPKNISAATATEAAPKLYLRIEKRKTFSRCWRLILLSEFDLFSIVPPYVKTQNQIKSNIHGYTSYSNAPIKPTMMSIFYTSQLLQLNYTIFNVFNQTKLSKYSWFQELKKAQLTSL